MRDTKVFSISLPPKLATEAERVAKKELRTKSELFREALRSYLAWREFKMLQRDMASRSRSLGLKGEADIERIVDEIRK